MGIQAQIWGETMTTPERIEYMALPRMLALSERAWAQAPDWSKWSDKTERTLAFEQEWSLFSIKTGKFHFDLLHRFFDNIQFRVPPPGIIVRDNKLHANTQFPDLEIRYTTDGSTPNRDSYIYTQPLDILFSNIKLRAFSTHGNASRVVEWVA